MLEKLYTISELKKFANNLASDIKLASTKKTSSISFGKTLLSPKLNLKTNDKYQVVVFGGTKIEVATVIKTSDGIKLEDIEVKKIPKLNSKEVFQTTFEEVWRSSLDKVVLSFAFPMKAFLREGRLDGSLIRPTKEHMLQDLIGQEIGLELEALIAQKYRQKIQVWVCNDTLALAQNLQSFFEKDIFNQEYKFNHLNSVAGIVGTGFNFGLFLNSQTFVNLELGNFNNFRPTKEVMEIDTKSQNPNQQLLEKAVAGAYLHKRFNLLAKKNDLDIELASTEELSQLASQKQQQPAVQLAKNVIQNSTALVAATLYGLYIFKQDNILQKNLKLLALIEGSVYWKCYNCRHWVDKYLDLLKIKDKIQIVSVKNSSLMGGANLLV